jgi:hypothetical protein
MEVCRLREEMQEMKTSSKQEMQDMKISFKESTETMVNAVLQLQRSMMKMEGEKKGEQVQHQLQRNPPHPTGTDLVTFEAAPANQMAMVISSPPRRKLAPDSSMLHTPPHHKLPLNRHASQKKSRKSSSPASSN